MEDILEELLYERVRGTEKPDHIKEIEKRIDTNKELLKTHLNKGERILLLRITDAKDLIIEETSSFRFIQGFKLGLKIGYETNRAGLSSAYCCECRPLPEI